MRHTYLGNLGLVAASAILVLSACGGNTDDGSNAGAQCGNGTCETGESSSNCPSDCGGGAECGNGACETGEDATSCAQDCASAPVCGNGTCETGEDATSCAQDCASAPVCGNGTCETGEDATSCAQDCASAPVCGNGTCETGEDATSCAQDCAFDCQSIGAATNVGSTCQAAADCGAGGVCANLGSGAQCYQTCVPGLCIDMCTGGDLCLTVLDQNGNPVELQPGVPAGVCDQPPTGNAAIYEACGQEACQAGLVCGGIDSAYGGMCLGSCQTSTDCPAAGTTSGECVLNDGNGNKMCALVCTAGDNSTCPTGMECVTVSGGALCLWPK